MRERPIPGVRGAGRPGWEATTKEEEEDEETGGQSGSKHQQPIHGGGGRPPEAAEGEGEPSESESEADKNDKEDKDVPYYCEGNTFHAASTSSTSEDVTSALVGLFSLCLPSTVECYMSSDPYCAPIGRWGVRQHLVNVCEVRGDHRIVRVEQWAG
mmetsp:Transcript_30642/g.91696  ORF Transcript_30642/g.91696 Transcript_30642/m.91696 type:complete len:156 (-) Transcript_30642:889-1356(-)